MAENATGSTLKKSEEPQSVFDHKNLLLCAKCANFGVAPAHQNENAQGRATSKSNCGRCGGARVECPPKPQKEPRAKNPLESRPDAHRLSLVRFLLSRHQTWRWRFAKIIRLLIISPTNRPRSLIKCQILRYFKRLEFAKIMGKSGRFERPPLF